MATPRSARSAQGMLRADLRLAGNLCDAPPFVQHDDHLGGQPDRSALTGKVKSASCPSLCAEGPRPMQPVRPTSCVPPTGPVSRRCAAVSGAP